jgi:hypothetical protein
MAATPICQRTTSNSNKAAASAPSSNSAAKQSVDSSKTLSNGHATETTPLVETKSGQVVDEDALHHEYEFGALVSISRSCNRKLMFLFASQEDLSELQL